MLILITALAGSGIALYAFDVLHRDKPKYHSRSARIGYAAVGSTLAVTALFIAWALA